MRLFCWYNLPLLSSSQIVALQLSEDQVLALAPDEASKKAGKDLSGAAKWVSKGMNEQAIWGECQGSGSKPYQTQVDIVSLAFKCSCPSRKFPCKHGLGLLLFNAKQGHGFTESTPPTWVAEWLAKRTGKEEKKAEQSSKPVDEAAQAKRQQAREQSVEDGMDELLLWMKDVVRNGIIGIPEKGTAIFDSMAKRMVDAKAPGLAAMLKSLSYINYYKEGWQHQLLDQLTKIYLVITGFKNKGQVNPLLLEDIKASIGFTQNQESLKEQQGINDHWFVLGKQVTEEDSVTTERNWLYGIQSQQYALVLQFSVRGQGIAFSLTPGMFLQAELAFFPSAAPLRAIVKRQVSTNDMQAVQGFANWQAVSDSETKLNSALPFHNERPVVVQQLKPVYYNAQWYLQDSHFAMVQIKHAAKTIYPILAISGGQPLSMALVGKENSFEPIGIWANNQYTSL